MQIATPAYACLAVCVQHTTGRGFYLFRSRSFQGQVFQGRAHTVAHSVQLYMLDVEGDCCCC